MTVPTTFPTDSNTTWPLNTTLCAGPSCPVTDDLHKVLMLALNTGLSVMLALVMFSMGCNVDPLKLWGHIRRPWGITLGVLCQFGIMPLTAFTLTKAFNVLPIQAMVILIMGCCPGGTGSNILTYWLDGDMDLSVSMTTCTTILAMGMMPLCLYIYSSHWDSSSTIQIPYRNIGVSLVCLMIPVALGSCIKHRWPKAAKKIVKIGSIMGMLLIIVIAVVAAVLYKSSWSISPSLWIIGAIFPFLGFSLGFLFSWLVRQSRARCRTIALETGFQNGHLCNTIVQLSFSHEELELMFTFPLIYCIFQIVLGLVTVGGYQAYKRYVRVQKDEATPDHERETQCQLMNERSSGGGRFTKL